MRPGGSPVTISGALPCARNNRAVPGPSAEGGFVQLSMDADFAFGQAASFSRWASGFAS